EPLPSEREEQRWGTSKHFSQIMDDLQAKLVLYTQRMNTYTGTDYSGIEALRRDIKASEAMVKDRLNDVRTAKESVDKAHIQQASSQKEVVGLLERKHSWSAGDLERYMSLIRSEHVNEQAIQTAKDGLAGAERGLEEVRTRLEKKERQQYHEEQIWSDTIRRNSTWVTIGLMGLNIALLLSNVAIIEPRRRRRLVREIKAALAEQTEIQLSNTATGAEEVSATVETTASDSVETPNAVSAPDIAGIEQVLDELP
ncbi:mitochondrial distribution and morphology family 33, partial [Eremomyces bilateralis CBS 781.70]